MFKSATSIVALAAVANGKITSRTAKGLNYYRRQCNASAGPDDGIHDRNKAKQMSTALRYKNYLLEDCKRAKDKNRKLTCIQ